MKIAIYEEDLKSATILKRLIYDFSNKRKIDSVVKIFTTLEEFSNSKEEYILYFISYNTKNGISAAKHLNNKNIKTHIIITSNDCRLAADAFKIRAYNFLELPINEKALYDILNNFFDTNFLPTIIFSTDFDNIYINTNDIMYIEADNKHCLIHLSNNTINCKKTMARVVNALPENLFLKINRSFVVNSNYITRFNSKNITLKNGTVFYPSRHYYKNFKCDFLRIKSPIII